MRGASNFSNVIFGETRVVCVLFFYSRTDRNERVFMYMENEITFCERILKYGIIAHVGGKLCVLLFARIITNVSARQVRAADTHLNIISSDIFYHSSVRKKKFTHRFFEALID